MTGWLESNGRKSHITESDSEQAGNLLDGGFQQSSFVVAGIGLAVVVMLKLQSLQRILGHCFDLNIS